MAAANPSIAPWTKSIFGCNNSTLQGYEVCTCVLGGHNDLRYALSARSRPHPICSIGVHADDEVPCCARRELRKANQQTRSRLSLCRKFFEDLSSVHLRTIRILPELPIQSAKWGRRHRADLPF